MPSPHAVQLLVWSENILNPVAAEVGVYVARTSQALLVGRGTLTLHMIDSWAPHREGLEYNDTGDFHAHLSAAEQERYYQMARTKVAFAGRRAVIHRMDSVAAAAKFPNYFFHFVFIDADHSYEGCLRDIMAWLPKVQRGGFISGHDYDNPDYPQFGVKRAVDEFFGSSVETGMGTTWRVKIPK